MQRKGLMAFSILAILIFGISCVHAQADAAMGPDYKWSYAQTYSEEQLAASGLIITDNDIAFGRMKLASGEKACTEMGGVWCDYANADRNALAKLLNVKARQSNSPLPDISGDNSDPVTYFSNIIYSAWEQLVGLAKAIFG